MTLVGRKVGSFGGKNRPGFPSPWRVVGKFASAALALAPLYMMNEIPSNSPPEVLPLSRLADSIIANYFPKDTIVIAMTPSNFCVGHLDIVMFWFDFLSYSIIFVSVCVCVTVLTLPIRVYHFDLLTLAVFYLGFSFSGRLYS